MARPSSDRLGYLLVAPTVLILLSITAFPLAYNLWNSLRHVVLTDPSSAGFAGLENYRALLGDPQFAQVLARTSLFTVVSVSVQMAVGLMVALVLHRRFRGRGLVRAAVLIPWAVPTVVAAISWKTMLDPQSGVLSFLFGVDTAWLAGEWTAWIAIAVADGWKTVPFVAIILLAGLQVIPGDIYEAARVDGSGAWHAFWKLTLPLLKPALMVALIFRTLSALLIFDVIFILTGGGPGDTTETLSYVTWREFLVESDFGGGGAVSVLMLVLSLVIAGAYTRLFRLDRREG
ncbi:carbohydrate ABC transporter permease [Nonomuraea lactucae]|uniref:carbohydrate ABC transporter permease n=1 Tax=Nonomuraea lactucae TaxID=2249762 RepID=UPI000DE38CAB|nr:sugar ABC transporter permease [Nonomuraea lactucae]